MSFKQMKGLIEEKVYNNYKAFTSTELLENMWDWNALLQTTYTADVIQLQELEFHSKTIKFEYNIKYIAKTCGPQKEGTQLSVGPLETTSNFASHTCCTKKDAIDEQIAKSYVIDFPKPIGPLRHR